ncbi:MAG TPA: flavodoxin [Candidatus Scatovivens faecipullorum]|nr:flavodoxin [Candidatus Scatovivens faecipullorum]
MNKKIIALIVVIILLIIIGGLAYFVNQNRNETQNSDRAQENVSEEVQTENEVISSTINTEQQNSTEENVTTETGKTLVVYFSAQGHTKEVAQRIANNLGADIFELVPANEYTSDDLDWTDSNSRVTQEYEDESLRNIELVSSTVDNWEEYDTVLIGYPIWWGIAAWPVDTFVKANDFNGKTVIPFCTSSSSGLGESGTLLAEEANGGNWLEGHRFRSNPLEEDVDDWTDSLK